MDIKLKTYKSVLLLCLTNILMIKPTLSRVEPLRPPQCGQRPASEMQPLIVGGHPAKESAWPWIGLLGYGKSMKDVDFSCAGSLLSSQTVVTAGHCVDNVTNLLVIRFGTNVREESESVKHTSKPVDHSIKKIILHPKFNPKNAVNDIALVILEKPVEYTDRIRPICLPMMDNLRNNNFHEINAIVAGWGVKQEGERMNSVLYQAMIPTVDLDTCKNQYKNLTEDFVVDDRVICGGYPHGGKDACQGDSGGPLMLSIRTYYHLIGIVSRGYYCARPNYSGIYTRITYFLDFILKNLV